MNDIFDKLRLMFKAFYPVFYLQTYEYERTKDKLWGIMESIKKAIEKIKALFMHMVNKAKLLYAAAIKKDPAIVSQPLLTTIVDVTSLLVYFGFAAIVFNI